MCLYVLITGYRSVCVCVCESETERECMCRHGETPIVSCDTVGVRLATVIFIFITGDHNGSISLVTKLSSHSACLHQHSEYITNCF